MSRYELGGLRSNQRWARIFLGLAAVFLVIALAGTLLIRNTYQDNLRPVSASQRAETITVPSGASAKEIASTLEESGVIRAAWAFEWYVRNNGLRDKLQAGTYSIRPNQSVPEIAEIMTQGRISTDLVTIYPAQRIDQVRQALINNGYSQGEVDRALNPALYRDHPALVDKPAQANLEGYLYPESFHKSADTKPEAIVRASLDEMQKYLTPELRRNIVRQGLTVHEGIILASIIEQEVGSRDVQQDKRDKQVVAQIFLRRLQKENMPLESDATAPYGAVLDGRAAGLSHGQLLTYESPYNTYRNRGLPPTPISNVSRHALEAVANPADTDYLFFVSGDDGKKYFSRTLAEHEELVRRHCKRCTI
jgi:UPF0755 protein